MNFKINIVCMVLAMFFLLFSCGEKSGPNLNFTLTGADALDDGSVAYLVFKVSSQPTGGSILDSNSDGQADVFGYPKKCIDQSSPTYFKDGCGWLPSDAPFKLEGIPLDFNYQIRVFFYDSGGSIIYWGESSTFMNTSGISSVSIRVEDGAPPNA